MERKEEGKLLSDLGDQDLKQPIVLICDKGFVSKKIAQELQNKGFINVYFIEGGLKGLLGVEK